MRLKSDQAEVIAEIEKSIGQTIPQLKESKNKRFGVEIENGDVIELNLYSNKQLTKLPNSLSKLKAIKKLSVGYNGITNIPKFFNRFQNLEELDLAGNKLSFFPESLTELNMLKSLKLQNNQITVLPDSLGNLKSLEKLDLSSNKLESLISSIGKLKSLNTLNLERNKLVTLPDSIENLKMLQFLFLKFNNLTVLPEVFGNLSSLIKLDLNFNRLSSLPESFGRLKSLKYADLSHNQLTNLPKTITGLVSLENLIIDSNKLTEVSDSICNLRSLRTLSINSNDLNKIHESIRNLKSLETLNLFKNQLRALPESIGDLHLLQELDLSENLLNYLPESIGNLSSLKSLLLGDNKLTKLPESFSKLINLEEVVLTVNNWKGEWKELSNKWVKENLSNLLNLCIKLNGLNIFISHAVKDLELYRIIELRDYLENYDIIREVYICEEDLVDSIKAFMAENIPNSHLLIFIATQNSVNSIDCQYELALAKKYGIDIWLIRGFDINWNEKNLVDLKNHNQGILELNKLKSFKFDAGTFNIEKIFEEINEHEFELKLLKRKETEFEKLFGIIEENLINFIDSQEFREKIRENIKDFEGIFLEVSNNKINPLQYFSETGKLISKKN